MLCACLLLRLDTGESLSLSSSHFLAWPLKSFTANFRQQDLCQDPLSSTSISLVVFPIATQFLNWKYKTFFKKRIPRLLSASGGPIKRAFQLFDSVSLQIMHLLKSMDMSKRKLTATTPPDWTYRPRII